MVSNELPPQLSLFKDSALMWDQERPRWMWWISSRCFCEYKPQVLPVKKDRLIKGQDKGKFCRVKEGVVERPDVHLAGGDGDAEKISGLSWWCKALARATVGRRTARQDDWWMEQMHGTVSVCFRFNDQSIVWSSCTSSTQHLKGNPFSHSLSFPGDQMLPIHSWTV